MLTTPITLEVLMHCYYSPTVHPKAGVKVYQEAFEHLINNGMIEKDDRHYVTTAKGKFFVEFILQLPFPKTMFTIPGFSVPAYEVTQTLSDTRVTLDNLIQGKRGT